MTKFLVLYQSTVPALEQMKNATPEQMKGHPHLQAPGALIEVFEFLAVAGM